MSTVKEIRNSIGADVLVAMAANDEFPISNKRRVAKTMQEYYESEGFEVLLVDIGAKWRPSVDYWDRHLASIREYLREEKKLFLECEYLHDEKTKAINGVKWYFVRKGAFEKVMAKELAGIDTRVETYNNRNGDGHDKWKLETPYISHAHIEHSNA